MIYIKAPTQSLQLAFAQNIMWYGISLYYHSSKKLRPYRRWEIPVAYLVCFVCINDWELHRIHSHIRSKFFFCTILNMGCPARQKLGYNSRSWCQHAVSTELSPSLQMGATNEVGIMSLLLWISINRMWVFMNGIMKLHHSNCGSPSIHVWVQ